MQIFMLISNPLKKFLKNAPKKSYKQKSLMNMSKSGKSAYFRHTLANNFFLGCSTQTRTRMGCLRKSPGVDLIPTVD